MASLTLTVDTRDWEQRLALLGKRAPVALARALNRTGASERTAMGRAVSKDMGLKVAVAREAIKVEKATAASLAVRVVARGKRLPLIDFKARGPEPSRGRGRGVSYVMQGQRKRLDHAFIATVGAGHRGVFVRTGPRRLPIKQLFGVSIAKSFENQIDAGVARRKEVLLTQVEHEIEFELSRLRGGT